MFISYYATDTVKHGGGRQIKIEIFFGTFTVYQLHRSSSKVTISGWICRAGYPVEEDGGIPPHQEEGDSGPGVACAFILFPSSLPGHCLGNLCHLFFRC